MVSKKKNRADWNKTAVVIRLKQIKEATLPK
jgi:hypothetical protein